MPRYYKQFTCYYCVVQYEWNSGKALVQIPVQMCIPFSAKSGRYRRVGLPKSFFMNF